MIEVTTTTKKRLLALYRDVAEVCEDPGLAAHFTKLHHLVEKSNRQIWNEHQIATLSFEAAGLKSK